MNPTKPRNPALDTIATCLMNALCAFLGGALGTILTYRALFKAGLQAGASPRHRCSPSCATCSSREGAPVTRVARLLGCLFWLFCAAMAMAGVLAATSGRRPLALGLMALVLGVMMIIGWAGERAGSRSRPPRSLHGSARWGDAGAHTPPAGLILGRDPRSGRLVAQGDGHLLTVAPTGSGKGVSAVIPNLLDYPGSVVVLDLKGENYAVTAPQRAKLGGVVALDPFGFVGGKGSFNVLDLINHEDLDADTDAGILANLLVIPEEGEGAHFAETAEAFLKGLILYVAAHEPAERRRGAVRGYFALPPREWQTLLENMASSEAVGGLIASAANGLTRKEERERSGVISTADKNTRFLENLRLGPSLRASSFLRPISSAGSSRSTWWRRPTMPTRTAPVAGS